MKLSIVIPCFNEEKNIPLILKRFNEVISSKNIEVILVNNGSTDNSQKVIDGLLSEYPFAKTVKIEINQGYGFGITTGLKEAAGEYIGWSHADLQTDPADVVKAFQIIISSGYPEDIYVKGNRKGRSFFDLFFTFGMSTFESIFLGKKLWDINAQPNVFHRTFFESLKNIPKDFSLDLYFLYMAKKKCLNLVRFDVVFPPRIHGKSSWNNGLSAKWRFIKRTINFSLKLRREL